MYKIGVVGHLGNGMQLANGQTVKTKMLIDELERKLGEEVSTIDTHGWMKRPISLLLACFHMIRTCRHIVVLPAYKGVRVFIPLFIILNVLFKRRIHYVVIGGWLVEFLKKHTSLQPFTRMLASIHVESSKMQTGLQELGHSNVHYMPNFKRLPRITAEEVMMNDQEPYALCTFSRIMREKGIEDAVDAVTAINKKRGRVICTLDIYGAVESGSEHWFESLMERSESYIHYRGMVSHDQSVATLKPYFLLLFPTYFAGEGFAGTLLDCLASGVPVLATDWKYNSEIIKDGVTGFLYHREHTRLESKLEELLDNPLMVQTLRINCLREYELYDPDRVVQNFVNTALEQGGRNASVQRTS